MDSGFDHRSLIDIFVAEALEGTTGLARALHPSEASIPSPECVRDQYIVAHRIRGAAALYGYGGVAQLAERLEAMLEGGGAIPAGQWPGVIGAMREIVQGIHTLVQSISHGGSEEGDVVSRCLASAKGLPFGTLGTASSSSPTHAVSSEYLIPAIDTEVLAYFVPEVEEQLNAIEELVQALRANTGDGDMQYRMFRAAHTLKGSAFTVGYQVIGDIAQPMEDCMNAVREKRTRLSAELLEAIATAAGVIRLILRRDPTLLSRLHDAVPITIEVFARLPNGRAVDYSPEPTSNVVQGPDQTDVSPAQQEPVAALHCAPPVDLSDDYLLPRLHQEILSYFGPEAQEYLETLEADLLRLERDPQNGELINQLFRTAHTLKGSAYTVGFQAIGDLVHHIEDFMGAVRDGRHAVLPGHTDLILRSVDLARVILRRDPVAADETRRRFDATLAELKRLEGAIIEAAGSHTETITPLQKPPHVGFGEDQDQDQAQTTATGGKPAEDRDVIRVSYARLERLMNLVGELVIGRGRLEQRLHVLEQLSNQVLMRKTHLLNSVQTFADKHTFTFQSALSRTVELTAQRSQDLSDFTSLELDKYDDFNILARRINEVTAAISESILQLNVSIRNAHDDMSELQHLTLGIRDEITRARMVPVGTPFTRFRRAIREMARASNKEVTLITTGEQTEVDTGIVERLVDPLIHLVRNAVYHGVEAPAERVSKGKPPVGTVYLHAAHRGNSIIIEVEDDGAGLDLENIRMKAISLGLVRSEQAQILTEEETLQFIFVPGFSTANRIGYQAGRGVGLDVVKQVIERMNGHIAVESLPDVGTKFTLSLPLTLLIATALLVRVGEERYAIPLPSIREITSPATSSLQTEGKRTVVHLGEEAVEVRSLRHALRRESGTVDQAMPIVIMQTAEGPIGMAVDEVLGRQEIVIKTLGSLKLLESSFFGGATVDPEGHVILVVDPSRFGAHASGQSDAFSRPSKTVLLTDGLAPQESDQAVADEVSILLIDDSLSIRKFVGKMLESAGYRVDTAVDGEDGLRKASEMQYRLIITDLELPKLNGFEVVQALRSHPRAHQTPVVVMTSRAGDKHRHMAINIGATSYIAKPVEEHKLLQEIERWVGRAPSIRR